MPIPDPDLSASRQQIVLEGDVPSPISPPTGCRFHPRCRYATDICKTDEPPLVQHGSLGHLAACHHPLSVGIPLGHTPPAAVTGRPDGSRPDGAVA